MAEELDRCETKDAEIENVEKSTYTCNSCGKEDDTGYFYCEECHRIQKNRHRKDQIEQKEEADKVAE